MVCRAFKKRTNIQTRSMEYTWDSSFCYEEPSSMSTIIDSMDYLQPKNQPRSVLCKKEVELESFCNSLSSDPFVQLPHLDSPSLLPPKKQLPISNYMITNTTSCPQVVCEQEDERPNSKRSRRSCDHYVDKVTDWRDLDKFVASQLSQGDGFDHVGVPNNIALHDPENPDVGLFLMHSNPAEERNRVNEFWSSATSEYDIGICIFEN